MDWVAGVVERMWIERPKGEGEKVDSKGGSEEKEVDSETGGR